VSRAPSAPVTPRRRAAILATVDLADLALRTLAVAYRPIPAAKTADEPVAQELIHLGLAGIIDPRLDRRSGRGGCARGDDQGRPSAHGRPDRRDLGFAAPGERALSGPEIGALEEQGIRAAAAHGSVYSRRGHGPRRRQLRDDRRRDP
jgi:Ca2+-transporting ATPase